MYHVSYRTAAAVVVLVEVTHHIAAVSDVLVQHKQLVTDDLSTKIAYLMGQLYELILASYCL